MKLIKISNKRKMHFLESKGVLPVHEEYDEYWYKPTKQLQSLLEDYAIMQCFYENAKKR